MFDITKANEIYMHKMKEDPYFSQHLIDSWREQMPDQFARRMYEEEYGCHIVDEDMYKHGLLFIKDNHGNLLDPWNKTDILKVVRDYIDIDKEDFYDYDIAMMANIFKGDFYHRVNDSTKIILMAIDALKDNDFPYFSPSERAYKWVIAHLYKS
jgi:hypothetical protein